MNRLALLPCLLLVACATPAPRIEIKEVLVPVPVPCMERVGPAPSYQDTPAAVQAAPTLFDRVKLLLVGREERDARLRVLEGQALVCAPQ